MASCSEGPASLGWFSESEPESDPSRRNQFRARPPMSQSQSIWPPSASKPGIFPIDLLLFRTTNIPRHTHPITTPSREHQTPAGSSPAIPLSPPSGPRPLFRPSRSQSKLSSHAPPPLRTRPPPSPSNKHSTMSCPGIICAAITTAALLLYSNLRPISTHPFRAPRVPAPSPKPVIPAPPSQPLALDAAPVESQSEGCSLLLLAFPAHVNDHDHPHQPAPSAARRGRTPKHQKPLHLARATSERPPRMIAGPSSKQPGRWPSDASLPSEPSTGITSLRGL